MDRHALFNITYGLYAITSIHKEKTNGFIGNTLFQITSQPPCVAIGVSLDNYTYNLIQKSGVFSASILNRSVDSQTIQTLGYQSGRDIDKFSTVPHIIGENGAPILKNGINAFFECNVIQEIDMGSHGIFIGEVIEAETMSIDSPVLTYEYYRNTMKGKAPKNAPTYVAPESTQTLHTCGICGYEYNPEVGDPEHNIPAGTPFEELPADWRCPICSAPITAFK